MTSSDAIVDSTTEMNTIRKHRVQGHDGAVFSYYIITLFGFFSAYTLTYTQKHIPFNDHFLAQHGGIRQELQVVSDMNFRDLFIFCSIFFFRELIFITKFEKKN